MNISYSSVVVALSFLFCSVLGFSLITPLGGPDHPFLISDWVGLGFIFLAWFAFVLRFGGILAGLFRFPADPALSVALGFLGFSYLPFVFAMFEDHRSIHGMYYFVAFGVVFLFSRGYSFPKPVRIERDARIPAALGFSGLSLIFLLSCFPDQNPDALWYHLPVSRYWAEHSSLVSTDHWIFLHSGLFDLLYFWPQIFFKGDNGAGLIHAHIFSQWIHFAAYLSSIFLARKILESFEINQWLAHWILLFSFSVPPLMLVSYVAKNDFGSILWILAGVFLWRIHGIKEIKSVLVIFGFFGAAFSAKFTAAFTVFPLAAWMIFPSMQYALMAAFSFLLFSFPILARNYLASGNPVFPLGNSWIPTLTPYVWENTIYLSRQISLKTFLSIAYELFWAAPLTILLPFLFWEKKVRPLTACSCIIFGAFVLSAGELTLLRWLGGSLLLICGLPVLGVYFWTGKRMKPCSLALTVVFIGTFVYYFPWYSLQQRILLNPAEKIRMEKGGNAFAFLRLNYPTEKVAVMDSSRLYYLPNAVRVWDSMNILREPLGPDMFLSKLKDAGFRFVLFTDEKIDFYQDMQLLHQYRNYLEKLGFRKVFSEGGAEVFEL